MNNHKGREIRNVFNILLSVLLIWLYVPALIAYMITANRPYIKSDLDRIKDRVNFQMPYWLLLVYFLHIDRYFRCLFYYRIGPVISVFINWIRPGDPYFVISKTMSIGKGCKLSHPFSTILNADRIGDNFSCINSTTVGGKYGRRPIIGNNVKLGVNVTVIGGVKIGDNVIVGAGSVVVKDVPSNCVVAGNPAKVIKEIPV